MVMKYIEKEDDYDDAIMNLEQLGRTVDKVPDLESWGAGFKSGLYTS